MNKFLKTYLRTREIAHFKSPAKGEVKYLLKTNDYRLHWIRNAVLEIIKDPRKYDKYKENEPWLIYWLDNPTEEQKRFAVSENGFSIKYIENPSEELQLMAIESSPHNIEHIKNPTDKVQLKSVQENKYLIRYIKNPSKETQLYIVSNGDGFRVKDLIDNGIDPYDEVKIIAGRDSISALNVLGNLSRHVQMGIVSEKPSHIIYIKNPHEDAVFLAIQKHPFLFNDFKNFEFKDSKLILKIIKEVKESKYYLPKNLPSNVQVDLLKDDLNFFWYLKDDLSVEAQLYVVENKPHQIVYIKNKSPEAIALAKELGYDENGNSI